MNTSDYIRMSKGSPIQGYSEYEDARKADWLKTGRRLARQLAKELGLKEKTYEVRVNPAGPAVSGDVHLHGEHIYVSFSQSCLRDMGFMWRTCSNRKDYTGNMNRWEKWEMLLDLQQLASIMSTQMKKDYPS
jgi:hypothetical protein